MDVCTYCGKNFTAHASQQPDLSQALDEMPLLYCSFECEVKALLAGLGWGVRWLGISLVWGVVLFAFMVTVGRAILGGPITDPTSFYALVVVLGLLTAILSVVWWRVAR